MLCVTFIFRIENLKNLILNIKSTLGCTCRGIFMEFQNENQELSALLQYTDRQMWIAVNLHMAVIRSSVSPYVVLVLLNVPCMESMLSLMKRFEDSPKMCG